MKGIAISRECPHLVVRRLRLGRVLVQEKRSSRVGKALNAGILDMLGDREQPGFENQRPQPTAGSLLPKPDVLGYCRTERPPADYYYVERPAACRLPCVDLGNVVAEIAALDVLGEGSSLGALGHSDTLLR